jgi:hypothetical protein
MLLFAVLPRLIIIPSFTLFSRGIDGFDEQVIHGIGRALLFDQVVPHVVERIHYDSVFVVV